MNITFDSDSEKQESAINKLTSLISSMFKQLERLIQLLTQTDTPDKTVKSNAIKNITNRVMIMSKTFQTSQVKYTAALNAEREKESKYFYQDPNEMEFNRNTYNRPLDKDTSIQMEPIQQQDFQHIKDRQDAIIQISQDVSNIQQLFQDLNTLVVSQGEVVDRIDVHVEKALDNVTDAGKELQVADSYSESNCTCKIIIGMVIVLIVLLSVFIYKKAGWKLNFL